MALRLRSRVGAAPAAWVGRAREPTQAAYLAFAGGRQDALTDPDGNPVELVGGD